MSSYRETLQRVAERTLIDPEAFTKLDRRRRRRHRNRRIVAAVVALAVAAGGTWGALALADLRKQARPTSAPRLPTATASGVTISFPPGWWLMELGNLPPREGVLQLHPSLVGQGWAVLQLSNFRSSVDWSQSCPASESMPANGVLLHVERGWGTVQDRALYRSWPVAAALPKPGRSVACGHLFWSVGDRPFAAMTAVGPNASPADRKALLRAIHNLNFEWIQQLDSRMSFILPSVWDRKTQQLTKALFETPKVIVASLTSGGRRFTFSVMPDALDLFKGEGPTLVLENGDIGPLEPPGSGESMIARRYSNAGQLHIVVGSVTKQVARVDVMTGGRTYRATLVDFPREFPGAYRGYFFNLDGIKANGGQIVARDSRGHVLQSLPLF